MKQVLAFKFTILSAGLILALLLLPASAFPRMPRRLNLDKIVHFVLFFVFTLCFVLEFKRYRGEFPRFVSSALLVLLFILLSELLQLFTRSRRFEVLDIAFDAAGAVSAALALWLGISLKKKS